MLKKFVQACSKRSSNKRLSFEIISLFSLLIHSFLWVCSKTLLINSQLFLLFIQFVFYFDCDNPTVESKSSSKFLGTRTRTSMTWYMTSRLRQIFYATARPPQFEHKINRPKCWDVSSHTNKVGRITKNRIRKWR